MPNYAYARTDTTHKAIRAACRKAGYFWQDTYRQGDGCPDAFVLSKSGRWIALEIKSPGGTLTEAEEKVFDQVRGPLYMVTSAEQTLEILAGYDWEER